MSTKSLSVVLSVAVSLLVVNNSSLGADSTLQSGEAIWMPTLAMQGTAKSVQVLS